MTDLRLETRYHPGPDPAAARFDLTLVNCGARTLGGFRLCYGALTRVADGARVEGARLVRRVANFHEFAAPAELSLVPGGRWTFSVTGLSHLPKHRTDGPKSAYLVADGEVIAVGVGDLALVGGTDSGNLRDWPEGEVAVPLGILPWPNAVEVTRFRSAAPFCPAEAVGVEDVAAMLAVGDLAQRLFPSGPRPFRFDGAGAEVRFAKADLPAEGYALDFGDGGVTLTHADAAGRSHGLVVLAQMHRAASADPGRFSLPAAGRISDAPRHGWRGAHLDAARHFWTAGQVLHFVDILAWGRMNALQWHLTDDEGWRLEIAALPELTRLGARRGPDCEMVGQLGYIERRYEGHYTRADMREIVAHAAALHVQVVPEIDVPGHCTAALTAYPHLRDPDEPAASYRSIQGYANNALNPAMPETYEFLRTVFAEVAELFPSPFIHVGADEVDAAAWRASPRAQALLRAEGIDGTPGLQAHFLRRVQAMLRELGKRLAGWDEVSHGGGVDPGGALLVAWQTPEVIGALAEMGYDVVASPGQAYYLDMAQADGWNEPGTSWAGTVTPRQSYDYEAVDGLSAKQVARVKGVQAGIWAEHLITPDHFNRMVFPRLWAVAEAGWTEARHKSWPRFAALSRPMPQL